LDPDSSSYGSNVLGPLARLFVLPGLVGGVYLIATALVYPLESLDIAVVAGAFILALSGFLLAYCTKPRHVLAHKTAQVMTGADNIHPETQAPLEMEPKNDHTLEVIASD
jgi:hypothetical protein